MEDENKKYAELVEFYAKKIRRFKTPLTSEEKELIEKLGRCIMKRQKPRRIEYCRRKRNSEQNIER